MVAYIRTQPQQFKKKYLLPFCKYSKMAVTPTISAHDDIPEPIVIHGLPFLWHIQQTLPNAPPPITSTNTLFSPDVAAFLLAYHGPKR